MPELPEVETVVRTLELQLGGCQIAHVEVITPKIIDGDAQEFCEALRQEYFEAFKRRGKYLLFEMTHVLWVAHLRMEGKFLLHDSGEFPDRHTHVRFFLSDGRCLDYQDVRKFGRMEILPKDTPLASFKGLGPEPLGPDWNAKVFYEQLGKSHMPIKSLLMDQHVIAGIGNIYADEICFATHLHPLTEASTISERKAAQIVRETRRILQEAIDCGGSTVRSYTSSLHVSGRFQIALKAYGRQGQPCVRCGTVMKRIVVNQRGTCYCPHCQRRRK